MITKYSPDIVGQIVLEHIERILKEVARRQEESESDATKERDEL